MSAPRDARHTTENAAAHTTFTTSSARQKCLQHMSDGTFVFLEEQERQWVCCEAQWPGTASRADTGAGPRAGARRGGRRGRACCCLAVRGTRDGTGDEAANRRPGCARTGGSRAGSERAAGGGEWLALGRIINHSEIF